jgi:hypothetical protein
MVVRCAEEVATVKLQAKSAAAKFSERARAEKSALMVEIKQLQVNQINFNAIHLEMTLVTTRTRCLFAMKNSKAHWARERLKETRLPRLKSATLLNCL